MGLCGDRVILKTIPYLFFCFFWIVFRSVCCNSLKLRIERNVCIDKVSKAKGMLIFREPKGGNQLTFESGVLEHLEKVRNRTVEYTIDNAILVLTVVPYFLLSAFCVEHISLLAILLDCKRWTLEHETLCLVTSNKPRWGGYLRKYPSTGIGETQVFGEVTVSSKDEVWYVEGLDVTILANDFDFNVLCTIVAEQVS